MGANVPDVTVEGAAESHHAHCRIVEAFLAGDTSLARYRTRRHLDALSSWWVWRRAFQQ